MKRIPAVTSRSLAVIALALAPCPRAGAAEEPADAVDALRAVLRTTATDAERAAALERAAKAPRVGDTDLAMRVAASPVGRTHEPVAFGLLRRALLEAAPSEEGLADARRRVAEGLVPEAAGHATALLLGSRAALPGAAAALRSPILLEALRFEAPELEFAEGRWPSAEAWERHRRVAGLLERAVADGAGADGKAPTPMASLVAAGEEALPYLLAVAAPSEGGTPPGLLARRVRAIVALGLIRDRRATPTVRAGLDDGDGWVRVAAANALGDLGDPAAIGALCRVLFYLGDRHRPFDSWDYPGRNNVPYTAQEWLSVDYHSIDQAAADALLRLGVRNAAAWLIDQRLDPRAGNWRIRVPQDAADALRRAFPASLPVDYPPDGSVPDRIDAWRRLRAWWKTGPALGRAVAEDDPRFREGTAPIVAAVTGRSVMEQQIAGGCVELLGPAVTPALLEALPGATKRLHRAELGVALGRTRDPRAVPALVGLSKEEAGNVRASATAALGAFVRAGPAAKEALDAVLERAADAEEGPRAAAMEALANAPLDPRVLAAARAARGEGPRRPEEPAAVGVVLLVQTGEGLEDVLSVLRSPELWRRRGTWELLRRALDLEPDLFDPVPDPPAGKPIDAGTVAAALRARRAP